jgi:hypothetical protein
VIVDPELSYGTDEPSRQVQATSVLESVCGNRPSRVLFGACLPRDPLPQLDISPHKLGNDLQFDFQAFLSTGRTPRDVFFKISFQWVLLVYLASSIHKAYQTTAKKHLDLDDSLKSLPWSSACA